jgi:hypothetical protein
LFFSINKIYSQNVLAVAFTPGGGMGKEEELLAAAEQGHVEAVEALLGRPKHSGALS